MEEKDSQTEHLDENFEALRTAALRQHDANDGLTRWDLAETYDNDDNDALLA